MQKYRNAVALSRGDLIALKQNFLNLPVSAVIIPEQTGAKQNRITARKRTELQQETEQKCNNNIAENQG